MSGRELRSRVQFSGLHSTWLQINNVRTNPGVAGLSKRIRRLRIFVYVFKLQAPSYGFPAPSAVEPESHRLAVNNHLI
jgi:hypothetical protein